MKFVERETTVGIIANPASGRDIRRLVAAASVFPVAEKCNMITRLLAALNATGVERVLLIPDIGGISERLRRAMMLRGSTSPWPKVEFLDMPVNDGPIDSVCATEHMVERKVSAIVVLGGDGTHRLVAGACGDVPLMALSTGTNNVFPEMREATIAGMATGFIATGKVSKAEGTLRNKVLRVEVDGHVGGVAVVDASISSESWTGAKALWRPECLRQIFVTFAEPDAIGLSAIAGLVHPVSRRAAHGLRVDLLPAEMARVTLRAPIAPGLLATVGVAGVHEIPPGEPYKITQVKGVVALDGERDIEFGPNQHVTLRLDRNGPLSIDVEKVMTLAARQELLLAKGNPTKLERDSFIRSTTHATQQS